MAEREHPVKIVMSHAQEGTHLYFSSLIMLVWPRNAFAMFLAAVYAVPSLPGCTSQSILVIIDVLRWTLPPAAHGPRRPLPARQ